ncbi:hypothetical protein ACIQNK_27100 [Streptomyces sp. NPDC091273]|uniref:AMP-binding enzyme n=1 Tax=Streptomyces sp. NPDC091273 TaxID=3365982 RepID=UPI0037F7318E
MVLKPGGQATAEEIRDHVKAQVAAYKYPRVIRLTDALPKGPTGKILKWDIVITPTPS